MIDSVPKVEYEENEAELSGSAEPLNRTFETGVNTEKLSALMNQGSRTITRPIKPRPSNSTSGALNVTRTMVRERQKTMVIETQLVSDIRRILSEAKLDEIPELAGFENDLISTIQKYENETNTKQHEVPSKSDSSIELLMYKHFNADLRKMVKVLLSEVQKSKRVSNVSVACDGNCDHSTKLRLDLENAVADLETQHSEYAKFMEQFENNRKVLQQQKQEYIQMESVLNDEREMYKQLMEKFLRLRNHAILQLEQASDEIVNCENRHEESTKGLRLKVKAYELEIKTLRESVLLKRKENDDLQRMLRSVVSDLEVPSDISESENWFN